MFLSDKESDNLFDTYNYNTLPLCSNTNCIREAKYNTFDGGLQLCIFHYELYMDAMQEEQYA